ncbi:MAG: carbamoyltransferase HypF [Deltaproteobacteria bacterium]|nr:MAG: carbamoyltransferase HypF [Deltaproteobacteria bacterium]
MPEEHLARRLKVNGIVQGVGFRPFVYNLANQYNLSGEVANTSSGVTIHVEGNLKDLESFARDLTEKHPPLAHIVEIEQYDEVVNNRKGFRIQKSEGAAAMSTLISPDVSICEDCRRELFDRRDRRYGYPFINCTNCGPRYTIINDIPYDRPKTSMKHFKMCPQCQAEYDDPNNRRFHAQPNACDTCGPHVALYDNQCHPIQVHDPIVETANLIKQGYIVAIKGLGGFHLAVDAENDQAVAALRKRKHREEKPLALMSFDLDFIRKFTEVSESDESLLTSIQRPIVLLRKKEPNSISPQIAPRNRYFGVMLPYTPLHYLLLTHDFTALVMTSGNLSEEPIAIDNEDAFKRLGNIADYFLIHNRDIYLRSDDSIVRRSSGSNRFIRRSRGYVPVPVFLKKDIASILACGAELKNTICITKGKMAFLSQHIGDLENLATYEFFRLTIRHMKRILEVEPEIMAHDMHPDYLSTRWALKQQGIVKIPVQHHHAHIVSAMTENKIEGPAIGLSFDGTGYGTDGAIWGGEILIADEKKFSRAAHFAYTPMPGGTAAIKNPWRMAVSYLYDAFGEDLWNLNLPLLQTIDAKKLKVIIQMIVKRVNSPDTSSLGRLFDGVAAIVGLRNYVAFEGQAAMELEMTADVAVDAIYDYEWHAGDIIKISPRPIIREVVKDMHQGIDPSVISARFHRTLIKLFTELCQVIRKETTLNRVVLSGGVFQNSLLLTGLISALEKQSFEVFTHTLVPTNDGGICLGQAMVANATYRS